MSVTQRGRQFVQSERFLLAFKGINRDGLNSVQVANLELQLLAAALCSRRTIHGFPEHEMTSFLANPGHKKELTNLRFDCHQRLQAGVTLRTMVRQERLLNERLKNARRADVLSKPERNIAAAC